MTPVECQRAVVVSDVHLGYERSDNEAFLQFIETYRKWDETEQFILLGDTFDFWRRQNAKVFTENKKITDRIQSIGRKIIVVRGNHDYYLQVFADRFCKHNELQERTVGIERTYSIKSGGRKFFLMHGYELEVFSSAYLEPIGLQAYEAFSESMCMSDDKTGGIASWIWSILSGIHGGAIKLEDEFRRLLDPAEERELEGVEQIARSYAKNILLGLANNEVLVFGHTHKSFRGGDVINTGSWVIDSKKKAHTYVEIDNGNFEVKEFGQTPERLEEVRLEVTQMKKVKKRKKSGGRSSKK